MPGGNKTGPMGRGAMTGRGAGFCSGSPTPGYANQRWGLGRSGSRWFGARSRGWWNCFGQPSWWASTPTSESRENEIARLKEQAASLQQSAEEVRRRLVELEQADSE